MLCRENVICAEARTMVEAAASRAGMSVCDWLNEVILEAAEREGVRLAPYVFQEPQPLVRKPVDFDALHSRIDGLAQKIELIAQHSYHATHQQAQAWPSALKSRAPRERVSQGFLDKLAENILPTSQSRTSRKSRYSRAA